jgi:hypothetical protein
MLGIYETTINTWPKGTRYSQSANVRFRGGKRTSRYHLPITPNIASNAASMVTDSKLVAAIEARSGDLHVTSRTIPAITTPKSKPE